MNNIVVYIIIPVYNVEKYLKKCLDSVFFQTYKNIKVICINDGSTDNSLEVLNGYSGHSNLTVINQNNKGVSSARNAGLDILNYDGDAYLTFIDADDWVDSDYIENLVKMMEENNVDIVCSSFNLARGDIIKPYKHIEKEMVYDSLKATELLIKDETIQSHSYSKLYKIGLWKDYRYSPELFYMEDQDIIYKVFYASKKVFITNYSGYYYRQDNINAVTKRGITNSKVVSGLKGYYSACLYRFKKEDSILLHNASINALAAAYLTLIPYYTKKDENTVFINNLKRYVRKNRVVNKYHSSNKNNIIKRRIYLVCPPLYRCLYHLGKKFSKIL